MALKPTESYSLVSDFLALIYTAGRNIIIHT